jgi:hypothetical protein
MSVPRTTDDLFRAARAELEPTRADEARNLKALMAKLEPPPGGGGSSGSAPRGAAKGWGALVAKTVGALVVTGTAVIGLQLQRRTDPPPPAPPTTTLTSPVATTPSASPASSEPAAIDVTELPDVPSARARSRPSASGTTASAPPDSPGDRLAGELLLIERLHAAEQRGDFGAVLSLADEHERSFPDGALVEEREASRTAA